MCLFFGLPGNSAFHHRLPLSLSEGDTISSSFSPRPTFNQQEQSLGCSEFTASISLLISSPRTINQKSCGKGRVVQVTGPAFFPPLLSPWEQEVAAISRWLLCGKQPLEVFGPPSLLWTASSYTDSPRRLQQGVSVTDTEIYFPPPPHPAGTRRLFPGYCEES